MRKPHALVKMWKSARGETVVEEVTIGYDFASLHTEGEEWIGSYAADPTDGYYYGHTYTLIEATLRSIAVIDTALIGIRVEEA
jgi:hypothetical protein